MPSSYLQSGEYAAYGVSGATAQQVQQASTIIDAYLERPEGLAWAADYNGSPCYMAALSPQLTLTLAMGISPGQSVVASVSGFVSNDLIGDVLIADAATPANTEALTVTAVGTGQVTLQRVGRAHAGGVSLQTGLVLTEERPLPSKRSVTRVSRFPLVRVLAGVGRYAYGRRSDQVAGLYNDTNLLAALQTFGGPPAWVPFDVSQCSVSPTTGEVWIPAGLMLAYYSDVRLRYVAGFPASSIPSVVKQAAANIISKLTEFGDADPMFKVIQAGGTKLERWSDSMMDTDTKALLEPFRAKLLY